MKNILTLLLLLPTVAFCQNWEKIYEGCEGYSVQQTTDGGYIATGTKDHSPSLHKVYLLKTDENGDTLWTKSIQGTGGIGYSVKQTTDGGFIITGLYQNGTWVSDVYLIKTDHNGNTLWTKTFGGGKPDCGYSVQQTTDGGYIVAGYSTDWNLLTENVYLIKTDSNGDTLWTKKYGGNSNDRGYSVQQTSDEGYIITGHYSNRVYLIKTNNIGDTLWTKKYGGNYYGNGYSVKQTNDDGYIITGYIYNPISESRDVYLLKTNENGDSLWSKTYGGLDSDLGKSVEQTTNGGYIIAGQIKLETGGISDVYLIKTDENGDSLWTKTFNANDQEVGHSVQQTNDGGYIITGWTLQRGSFGLYLIKTNEEGNIVTTSEIHMPNPNRKLLKTIDLLGKEITKPCKNQPYIEIYDDGSTQKKMIIK